MYVLIHIAESRRFDLVNDQIVGKNKYVLVSFASYGKSGH